jgi:hypothetical protein
LYLTEDWLDAKEHFKIRLSVCYSKKDKETVSFYCLDFIS